VDLVAEDPSAAAEALAVMALTAVAAGAARGDARDENFVAGLAVLHRGADALDRSNGFMAEDPAVGDRRDVALEYVQIRAPDRHRVDANDRIGVGLERWLRRLFPFLVSGTVVHDCLHDCDLLCRFHG